MNSTTTMSILKRLRDVLRLRPHHDEHTSKTQYPIASRGFGRLFGSPSRWKHYSTGEFPPITRPLRPQSIFWTSTAALHYFHLRMAFRLPRPSLLDKIRDSFPHGSSISAILNTANRNPASGTTASVLPNASPSTAGPNDLASADNQDVGSAPAAEATVSPQTAPIFKLPNELLSEIMVLVLSAEPPYAPTHLRLLAPRHVCKHWRKVARKEIRKTLNASYHHFDASVERKSKLRRWFKRRAKSPALVRHEVSFQVDTRSEFLDLNLVKRFVRALRNCRQARVEIQGPGGLFGEPLETLPIIGTPKSAAVPSHIHSFSWISATLGIRHPIPLKRFPWKILVNDLPWSQLTELSLDCPLSDLDAFDIFSKASSVETVSLKFTQINQDLSGDLVTLPRLRSLTIETYFSVRHLFSKLSLPALENLDLKSPLLTDEESPILNQHLNIPWSQLRSLSLSNNDTHERRRCPVTAILTKCEQLERFTWGGSSDTFKAFGLVSSAKHLRELNVESDLQGCKLMLTTLLRDDNRIRRVNISYLALNSRHTLVNLARWTHITVSAGVTLSDLSNILINGKSLTSAAFKVIEGGSPLTSMISSPKLQELELSTEMDTVDRSLWERLNTIALRSMKISFGGHVLKGLAQFLERHPNVPCPLIVPIRGSSPYVRFTSV